MPGPGAYDSRPKTGQPQPTWVFGTEQKLRPQRHTNKDAPGPGNYDYRSLFDNGVDKGMGTSIVSRRPQSALSNLRNPGPGEYNPNKVTARPKTPSYKIGTEKRFGDSQMNESMHMPWPGAYDSSENTKTRKAPDCRFGGADRVIGNKSGYSPGPGHYDPNLAKSGPEFVMGMKTKPMVDQADPRNPGPGAYKPLHEQTRENASQGGKFGHDGRQNLDRNVNPGPGTYGDIGGLHTHKGTSVVFGTDPKCKQDINANPGPGNYDTKPGFPDVPAYALP